MSFLGIKSRRERRLDNFKSSWSYGYEKYKAAPKIRQKIEEKVAKADVRREIAEEYGLINQPKKKSIFAQKKIAVPQNINFAPQFTKEQSLLRELFNGEQTFGTGRNLPRVDGVLTTGNGLIKNGDYERRTGRMFGLR